MLWVVYNNLGYSQFRNLAERKISTLKRLIRQGIFGIPGPQQEAVDRSILETAIQGATNMLNNTPYTRIGLNSSLMCPGDIITPWKNQNPGVQDLPEMKLQTLLDAQRAMTIRQSKMRTIMMEELRLEVTRFKAGQLKLGSNKNSPQISPGGIVLLELSGQTPQLGVVLSMNQRDIRVRKQNGGEASLALGQCIPITPSDNMWGTRQGESFTHFISMEFKQDETFKAFQKKVLELQERMSEVDGV